MVKLLTFEHFMLNLSSAVVVPFRRTYKDVLALFHHLFVTKTTMITVNAKIFLLYILCVMVMNEGYQ